MRATRFKELIELLNAAGVEFILVGGVAASALGSPRVTQDLDVVSIVSGQESMLGR